MTLSSSSSPLKLDDPSSVGLTLALSLFCTRVQMSNVIKRQLNWILNILLPAIKIHISLEKSVLVRCPIRQIKTSLCTNQSSVLSESANHKLKPLCFQSCVILLPCGHLCACARCVMDLTVCPLCRAEILTRVNI